MGTGTRIAERIGAERTSAGRIDAGRTSAGRTEEPRPVRAAAGRRPPRAGGGLVTLPPWTRAPLLPFRQPAVVLAVVAAAAILACAAGSAALFLSSASSESLRRIVAAGCPDAAYAAVTAREVGYHPDPYNAAGYTVANFDVPDDRARGAMTAAGLAEPYRVRLADRTLDAGSQKVRLFFHDGALSRLEPVPARGRPVAGRGVWVPEQLAQRLDLRAGSPLRFPDNRQVRVVGVYRNLFEQRDEAFWCSYEPLILNPSYGNDSYPPALVIASDADTFLRVRDQNKLSSADSWVSPVDTRRLTLTEARDIAGRQSATYAALGLPEPVDFGAVNSGPGQLPQFAERTTLIRDGLRGPVLPIALGGSLLALLLVGAAGSYWADRREREVRLLSARGVGPGALALKAALELALPALIGTALGWLLARWLVAVLGPSPRLEAGAQALAAATAGAGLVAGIALLALVAGLRSRSSTERPVGARRRWVAAAPWELLVLGAAVLCYLRLRSGEAVRLEDGIAQISLLVVVFPLLFLLGGAVLLVRLLSLGLPTLARRSGRLRPAWYLAARRVTAARAISTVMLAAAGAPVAMLVYAAGLTATSEHTLGAKARVVSGAEVALLSVDPLRRTPATDAAGTVVIRYLYGEVQGQNDDVAVLAIDPDTFARTAYWDRRFADLPLEELLARLRVPAPAGEVPAVTVRDGPRFPDRITVGLGTSTVVARQVGEARLVPGRRLRQPMMVVDRSRLPAIDPRAGTTNELWTNGDPAVAREAMAAQDARVFFAPKDRERIFAVANFVGVSWTFGYLTALAGLVGVVAVGGLLLYLETRQRSRVASYALGRRMGLTRGVHLRSLLAELGGLLGLAWVVGTGLAWTAILLVHGRVDIDPGRPPASLLTVPVPALVGSAVGVAVVVLLAALYAQRAADRADAASVLRLT